MFLGVDGGGTKTTLCLLNSGGRLVAQADAPSCYYFTQGIGLVERVLQQGVDEVCRQVAITPADITQAFIGLPSYGEVSGDVNALDAAPLKVLGHGRYSCDNDMVCGWAGSLGATDGINIISGTGSMAYGVRRERGVRVGGWGELFGDEGSAYWIATRGLAAFSQMCDGRLPIGPLHGMLREVLELEADLDLIDVVLNRWRGERRKVAALCRTVFEAAAANDICAERILIDAATELACIVDAARHRLEFAPADTVPVSYSGGVFTSSSMVGFFQRALETLHGDYDLSEPLYSPVVGAALYAAKLAGTPIDPAFLHRLGLP